MVSSELRKSWTIFVRNATYLITPTTFYPYYFPFALMYASFCRSLYSLCHNKSYSPSFMPSSLLQTHLQYFILVSGLSCKVFSHFTLLLLCSLSIWCLFHAIFLLLLSPFLIPIFFSNFYTLFSKEIWHIFEKIVNKFSPFCIIEVLGVVWLFLSLLSLPHFPLLLIIRKLLLAFVNFDVVTPRCITAFETSKLNNFNKLCQMFEQCARNSSSCLPNVKIKRNFYYLNKSLIAEQVAASAGW